MLWLYAYLQHRIDAMTFVDDHCLHRETADILKTYAEQEAAPNNWVDRVGLKIERQVLCSQATVVCLSISSTPVYKRGFLGRPESRNSANFLKCRSREPWQFRLTQSAI